MKQPSAPRHNRTPYTLGVIGLVVVAGYFRLVPSALAVLLVFAVVWFMSWIRKHENRSRFEAEFRQWHEQHPEAERNESTPPPPVSPPRSGWSNAGVVLAVIAAIGGMAILATVVLFFVALSTGDFGNK